MPIMQFGKYKGEDITQVPDSYLDWVARDSADKLNEARQELERRAYRINNSWLKKIIDAGYSFLDRNATDPEDKKKLHSAYLVLMRGIKDAGTVQDPNPPF